MMWEWPDSRQKRVSLKLVGVDDYRGWHGKIEVMHSSHPPDPSSKLAISHLVHAHIEFMLEDDRGNYRGFELIDRMWTMDACFLMYWQTLTVVLALNTAHNHSSYFCSYARMM